MAIQYLSYNQIDKQKWDACIDAAENGLVYAYSFYLDSMAKNWGSLVLNDYEAVMPLTWNKKFGIAYIYTPPFIQQLGIFSKTTVSEGTIKSFVAAAQQQFRFAELFINFNNGDAQPDFILPLHPKYELINKGYKNSLLKSLKHAAGFKLSYSPVTDVSMPIDLYKKLYGSRIPHVKEQDYANFKKVCEAAKTKEGILIRRVVDDGGDMLAIALLLKDKKRLYNIISAVTTRGRQCNASHYLYDQLIKEFCGQSLVLDFEGSSIPGIAGFYENFGAVNEPYYFLRYNHLPWPIKYFK